MEKTIREKFFEDLAAGAKWDVAVSIARNNPLPLDANSVFKSRADLDTYLAGKLAYVGQTVAIVGADETVLYVLDANKVPQEVGKATLGDDASISLDATTGILKIVGFDAAQTGAQLTKGADGKVSWVVPSTETVDGLKTTVESLRDTVNGKAAVGEEGSEGYQPAVDGLVQKVTKNTSDIAANTAAIATLNASATTEGSVAYQIAQIVENTDNGSIDTLKEIAAWIEDHPESVAEINKDVKANADAIDALELLVGSTAVATQIATKISEALTVDGVDKYALASSLTALATRVNTAEGKITTIENALTADPLHTHSNKAELDKIVADDVSKWNTAASDIATVKSNIELNPLHTHGNKAVLDAITTEKVNAWDAAETNAKGYTESYAATKAQGTLADTAVQSITVLGHTLDKNTKTSLTVDEAKTALGLGTAAALDATTLATKADLTTIKGGADVTVSIKDAYDLAASKITGAEVDTKIANAGHAAATDLTNHINNSGEAKHVTSDEKSLWNAAAAKVEELTGEDLSGSGSSTGGISAMIKAELDDYNSETVQPALSTINSKLDGILNETTGRLPAVEKLAGENAADIATLKKNVADNDTDIEKAKSDIAALQTASAEHALKSEVTASLAAKADKEAYEATAATVSELKKTIDGFFAEDAAIEGAIDTLKEIANYITNDTSGGADIAARVGAVETKLEGVEKVSTAISSAVSAEETRALGAEAGLSNRIKDLEDNKAGYATTTYVDSKASAAQTAAETFASTKVTELANGAVKTNTDNIATNTADISTLKTGKADKGESYLKAETYTKSEIEALIADATPEWGTF